MWGLAVCPGPQQQLVCGHKPCSMCRKPVLWLASRFLRGSYVASSCDPLQNDLFNISEGVSGILTLTSIFTIPWRGAGAGVGGS